MSIDNIEDLTPRVQYTAAAGQVAFDYPFPIFAAGDLAIDRNGTPLVYTTDFTLTGVGEDLGGTVTLLSACSANDIVTIWRDTEIFRTTDVPQNGGWSSVAYNDEMDRTVAIMQELRDGINRSIRLPRTTSALPADTELDVDSWANKFIAVDSTGQVVPAVMASTTVTAELLGTLQAPVTAQETAAGLTNINTRYGYGDPFRYGATGQVDHDDTLAVQAAFDMAANYPSTVHARIKPTHAAYHVTQVTLWGQGIVALLDNVIFVGIASSAKNSVLQLKAAQSYIRALKVTAAQDVYYKCAVHWYSNDLTTYPMGHLHLDGVNVQSALIGMVVGALPSQSLPQPAQDTVQADGVSINAPISECIVSGFSAYDCIQACHVRQGNGKLTFVSPTFVADGGAWGTASDTCALIVEGSEVTQLGGSLEQNSYATGRLAYIKSGTYNQVGATVESIVPLDIEGSAIVRIAQIQNWGLNSSTSHFFRVLDSATGELILADSFFQRPAGYSGAYPVLKCVSSFEVGTYSTAWDFTVRAVNCEFRDPHWTQGSTYNPMITGCRFLPINSWMTTYSGTTRTARYSLHLKDDLLPAVSDTAFHTSAAYPQTTSTTDAGWTFAVSNSSQQWGAGATGLPTMQGVTFNKYLRLTSTAGQNLTATSAKVKVTPQSTRLVPILIKGDGSAHNIAIKAKFYDFGGSASSTAETSLFGGLLSLLPSAWIPTMFWVQVPKDATQMALQIYAEEGADVQILLPEIR